MATSEALIEQTTRHAVYVERLKSGEVNQFAAFLQQIDRDIRRRLAGKELTDFSRKRLEKLLGSIEASLSATFQEHYDELAGHLIEIGQYEAAFESRNLNSVLANFETVIPAAKQVRAAIFSAPLAVRGPDRGKLLEPFIRDFSGTEIRRLTGAIRQGYFEGQTTGQILQTVRGTRAAGYRDGLLAVTNRNAAAIVRTSIQHVANTARFETWKENSDVVTGYRILATLDSRTSPMCRSLDGKVYPLGKGPVPPFHINCRTTTVAELDGRFKFLQEGATRAARDEHGVGSVDANTTYYSWLKSQPAAFQDSVIGPVRGKLLREGDLTTERFAELNLGRNFQPLTLAEMRKLEPLAFEKAYAQTRLTKQAEKVALRESRDRAALEAWVGAHGYRQLSGEVDNRRIRKQADEFGLTQPERVAIRHYTGTGYDELNRYLRGDAVSNPESVAASAAVLRTGLNKLPDYKGQTYRRTTLPTNVVGRYQVGKIVTEPAFTSSSYGAEVFEGAHRFIFTSKRGKPVSWISRYNDQEREVVFTSPTQFIVNDRYMDEDGILTIVMSEL